MLISKAFYRHLPLFLNLFKCPLLFSLLASRAVPQFENVSLENAHTRPIRVVFSFERICCEIE